MLKRLFFCLCCGGLAATATRIPKVGEGTVRKGANQRQELMVRETIHGYQMTTTSSVPFGDLVVAEFDRLKALDFDLWCVTLQVDVPNLQSLLPFAVLVH